MRTRTTSTTARRSIAVAAVIAGALSFTTAGAQPTAAEQRAEELFRAGRALLDQGKAAEACPKFEESQRLDPGLGTLLNLADCYERTERLASALVAFRSAEEQARALGEKKREQAATDRARSLEARVSRVTITLAPGDRPDGFTVRRNGVPVGAIDLGRPVAVDPGPVTIEATAPGNWQPFEKTVTITTARTVVPVDVPMLEPAGPAVDPGLPPAPEVGPRTTTLDPGRGRRRLAYIAGGVGVAALGGGIAIGFVAKGRWQDAIDAHCVMSDPKNCSTVGVEEADQARRLGNIGTIVGGVGVVAIAAGAVLWLTAPSARTIEVAPAVGPDGAGVTLSGRF